MAIEGFKDVELLGDCDTFTICYTPTGPNGLPQRMRLDADNEGDARFEAANLLGCKEEDLPDIGWS